MKDCFLRTSVLVAATLALADPAWAQDRQPAPSSAQANERQGNFGPQGGLGALWLFSTDAEHARGGLTGSFGGWVEGPITDHLSLVAEVSFVSKEAFDDYGSDLRLRYGGLAFSLKGYLRSPRPTFRLYVAAGPEMLFRVVQPPRGHGSSAIENERRHRHIAPGVWGGLGIEQDHFGLEVRGTWGPRSIFKEDYPTIKTFTLMALGRYRVLKDK